jgi:hypothetical protein
MLERQMLFETCFIWARRKDNGTTTRHEIMQRIGWFTMNIIAYQIKVKGEHGKKNNLPPSFTYYNKAN